MITEDYVSFETAKLLKEKGFDCPCHATYDTAVTGGKPKFNEYEVLNYFPYGMKNSDDKYSMVISAPTLQMAMKWLREVHNIHIVIKSVIRTYEDTEYYYELYSTKNKSLCVVCDIYKGESWNNSKEACEAAIKYCLENLI